jgi:PPK2 family polyphosphate:nucleotide phosphotransferase
MPKRRLEPVPPKHPAKIIERFKIDNGRTFRLADIDPGDTLGLEIDKAEAKALLEMGVKRLRALQERLYAEARWSLLLVLQAMDAAGKDGVIEHVMSGINPQGCDITAFKTPSAVDLKHDFLWRTTCALPERGRIGIFNRSYYEEVLVARVHKDLIGKQSLPKSLVGRDLWEHRFQSIRDFERHLGQNGTAVVKIFLHVSKDEQRDRLLARMNDHDKRWKFSAGDVAERSHWDDYMRAFEDAIRATATKDAPWYVVPADNKWFSRLVVAAAIVGRLEAIDPHFPDVDETAMAAMERARHQLMPHDKSG